MSDGRAFGYNPNRAPREPEQPPSRVPDPGQESAKQVMLAALPPLSALADAGRDPLLQHELMDGIPDAIIQLLEQAHAFDHRPGADGSHAATAALAVGAEHALTELYAGAPRVLERIIVAFCSSIALMHDPEEQQ